MSTVSILNSEYYLSEREKSIRRANDAFARRNLKQYVFNLRVARKNWIEYIATLPEARIF
jgi:hypothetical protein